MGLNGNKFPWYRERLRNKYSKDVNPILNHKNWTFVKNGLDDFRDGMPPDPGHGKLNLRSLLCNFYILFLAKSNATFWDWVVRPKRGPEPALLTGKKEPARPKLSAPRSDLTRKLNSEELYYSKQIPAADRRRRRVKARFINYESKFSKKFVKLRSNLKSIQNEKLEKLIIYDGLKIMNPLRNLKQICLVTHWHSFLL